MNTERPKIVLITGNGFDLNLKLETKYSDFAKSQEWQDMYKTCKSDSDQYTLLTYLNEKKDTEQWFDIEQALLDYASVDCKYSSKYDAETDKKEYLVLCETLGQYLKQHLLTRQHDISDCWGAKLLQALQHCGSDIRFYTFNFTSVKLIQEVANVHHQLDYVSVHGSYDKHSLIVGFETQHFENIKPEYTFLIKSNSAHYQSVNMQKDMREAKEVIIFGHSMNMIDAGYFKEYLQEFANRHTNRRLTIITCDNHSRICLLDNIRKMGIDVLNLYGYGKLDILMTKEKTSKQKEKFEELIKRIYHFKTL